MSISFFVFENLKTDVSTVVQHWSLWLWWLMVDGWRRLLFWVVRSCSIAVHDVYNIHVCVHTRIHGRGYFNTLESAEQPLLSCCRGVDVEIITQSWVHSTTHTYSCVHVPVRWWSPGITVVIMVVFVVGGLSIGSLSSIMIIDYWIR